MFKVLIGVIIVAIATLITFMVIDPNIGIASSNNSVLVVDANSLLIEEGYFSASIEGEVSKPGNYVLKDGSTLGDLVESAGGLTIYGDDLAYYEDAEISSGTTYYIPSKYDTTNVCELVELTKVNVNTSSLENLLTVSGISNTVANNIVSHRTEHGEFKTLEGLLDVYGIGNATYRKIRNYITLHE